MCSNRLALVKTRGPSARIHPLGGSFGRREGLAQASKAKTIPDDSHAEMEDESFLTHRADKD